MRRSGFTLIELLAVIAVVFLMTAITIPAVQNARTLADRVGCRKNLHTLAVAIHNYAETHNEYLPMAVIARSQRIGAGPQLGWGYSILPFLDNRNLYDAVSRDFYTAKKPPGKIAAFRTSLKMFRCPADNSARMNGARGGWATSNYLAVTGAFPDGPLMPSRLTDSTLLQTPPAKWGSAQLELRGAMGYGRSPTLSNILNADGTKHTFMAGERCSREGSGVWTGVSDPGRTDDIAGDCAPGSEINRHFGTGFSSHHKGIAMFLFVDGSALMINEKIDSKLGFTSDETPVLGLYQKLAAFQDSGEIKNIPGP